MVKPYFLILPVILLVSSANQVLATDIDNTQLISQDYNYESPSFWQGSADLVQEQLWIMDKIERSLYATDPQPVTAARSSLFFYLGKVERFLKNQYPLPELLCSGSLSIAETQENSEQVYCSLYQTNAQLQPLLRILEHRISVVAGINPNSLFPDNYRNPVPNELGQPIISQSRFNQTNIPENLVIGRPTKDISADSNGDISPAIAPSASAMAILQSNRQQLLSLKSLFPDTITWLPTLVSTEETNNPSYSLPDKVKETYTAFLAQPNTGIAKILPNKLNQSFNSTIANRLQSNLNTPNFAPLSNETSGHFVPSLAIKTEEGQFKISPEAINYGFMLNLGDIPLENISKSLNKGKLLSAKTKQLFWDYRPPQQLETIQVEQRRFIYGNLNLDTKMAESLPISGQVPASLNQTYLLRLIQYQLPEPVVTGQTIPKEARIRAKEILETPSSDLIIAFRPVYQWLDGSYTVLWQIIDQFPNPEINDLEEYVDFE